MLIALEGTGKTTETRWTTSLHWENTFHPHIRNRYKFNQINEINERNDVERLKIQ